MTNNRSHPSHRRRHDEDGSAAPMIIGAGMIVVLGAAAIIDGSTYIHAHTVADQAAFSAARAAGQQLEGDALVEGTPRVDTAAAAAAAENFLATSGVTGTVSIDGQTITITTTCSEPAKFAGLLGISDLTGTATRTATPHQN